MLYISLQQHYYGRIIKKYLSKYFEIFEITIIGRVLIYTEHEHSNDVSK